MHISNHLISPEAAILGGVIATTLVVVGVVKTRREQHSRKELALAGVMGAFIFAAQMFNFPIATIGCSGHLVGGVLLAALLGPWLGFVTLSGVLALQTLLFADGGIMALGWNIVNMAAIGALVVYPLLFRPIVRAGSSPLRTVLAGLLSGTVAVTLGAAAVVAESAASGISALPAAEFMGYMLPIHLAIGAIEGLATGLVLMLIARREPALLDALRTRCKPLRINFQRVTTRFALASLIIGGLFSLVASGLPDGLEWSISQTLSGGALEAASGVQVATEALQQQMALAPDYEGTFTGLIATAAILLFTWIIFGLGTPQPKKIEN